MARRYDSSTTTFSPEGRLHQVEYAIEAINNAGTCVGLKCSDGLVLASERKSLGKLLVRSKTSDKTYVIASHCVLTVAGLSADAAILIDECRLKAARYQYQYGEPMPIEMIVESICNLKQGYTQYGGLRPFGVAFLFAGYDEHHGLQLFQTDPSGNYSGWMATVIGANNMSGKSFLKNEYAKVEKAEEGEEGAMSDTADAEAAVVDPNKLGDLPDLEAGLKMAVKVLNKTLDSTTSTADKYELFTIRWDKELGRCVHRTLADSEVKAVLDSIEDEAAAEGDA